MQQPTTTPTWAENYETEINIDGRLVPNRFEPPSQVKLSGLKSGIPLGRQWLNYQFYLINQWIKYVKDFPAVNDVVTNTDNINPSTKYGFGSWVYLGSQTIGTTPVYYYKRVS